MAKTISRVLCSIATCILIFGAQAAAQSSGSISVSAAYSKGNSQYAVVVKDAPGTKLVLYVNDKQPNYATTNKEGWTTFHMVTLVDKNKVSFTKQLPGKNGKIYQHPINYVRYVHISNGEVSFATTRDTAVAPVSPPVTTPTTPAPTQPATPAPTPTQTPAPSSCTPLTNGGNCYEPGEYCRNSDHGSSGVAGDGKSITCTDNNGWRWEPS